MDAWKNLNSTGYATTDELYTNFGTVKKALENWPAFKVAGFAIYTDASPHAGAALLQDTDYVLEDLDAVKTAKYGEDIYTKVRMINNSTGDIYITYTAIGSYVPADVFQNMLSPYRPTALNISAGGQATDLSVYERGGASEKWNGWRIKVSWTGGVGTFFHLWTGTTYTIDGVAIADFICAGTGFVILELDKTNGNWILIEDGRELAAATYLTPGTVTALNPITFVTKVLDPYGMYSAGQFTIPKSGWYQITFLMTPNGSGNFKLYKSTTLYRLGMSAGVVDANGAWLEYFVKDEVISLRHDAAIGTYVTGKWMSICEFKK